MKVRRSDGLTRYLQSLYNCRKDDRFLILMVDLQRFVAVVQRRISIHEMENIL